MSGQGTSNSSSSSSSSSSSAPARAQYDKSSLRFNLENDPTASRRPAAAGGSLNTALANTMARAGMQVTPGEGVGADDREEDDAEVGDRRRAEGSPLGVVVKKPCLLGSYAQRMEQAVGQPGPIPRFRPELPSFFIGQDALAETVHMFHFSSTARNPYDNYSDETEDLPTFYGFVIATMDVTDNDGTTRNLTDHVNLLCEGDPDLLFLDHKVYKPGAVGNYRPAIDPMTGANITAYKYSDRFVFSFTADMILPAHRSNVQQFIGRFNAKHPGEDCPLVITDGPLCCIPPNEKGMVSMKGKLPAAFAVRVNEMLNEPRVLEAIRRGGNYLQQSIYPLLYLIIISSLLFVIYPSLIIDSYYTLT